MRKFTALLLTILCAAVLSACAGEASASVPQASIPGVRFSSYPAETSIFECTSERISFFTGTVFSADGSLYVEPDEGTDARRSADNIRVAGSNMFFLDTQNNPIELSDLQQGDRVEVWYYGGIAESYPAQINYCSHVLLLQ